MNVLWHFLHGWMLAEAYNPNVHAGIFLRTNQNYIS